jgi:hypothetical protein
MVMDDESNTQGVKGNGTQFNCHEHLSSIVMDDGCNTQGAKGNGPQFNCHQHLPGIIDNTRCAFFCKGY